MDMVDEAKNVAIKKEIALGQKMLFQLFAGQISQIFVEMSRNQNMLASNSTENLQNLLPGPSAPKIDQIDDLNGNKTPISVDSRLATSPNSKNRLGRFYNSGRALSMQDRRHILMLYQHGLKVSHIAKVIGVTHSCVSKIMSRYRKTGSIRPRSGHPLAITRHNEIEHKLALKIERTSPSNTRRFDRARVAGEFDEWCDGRWCCTTANTCQPISNRQPIFN